MEDNEVTVAELLERIDRTIAYVILRNNGVSIGKRDFLMGDRTTPPGQLQAWEVQEGR